MSPERLQRVQQLFYLAVECPTAERGALLATTCDADSDLRCEVESLVIAERRAGGLLDLDEERFPSGTVLLGRFRIIDRLGHGGVGEVYHADDLRLRQPVALKFLPAVTENDAWSRAQLLDEATLARQITHPNVCRVYDVGETDGRIFLSMEYIDGENLHALLRRIGRFAIDKALELGAEIARGLDAAHRQGILHRDLKPSNIMIDSHGRVRITDFGLATSQNATDFDEGLTGGTPAYMAPEQFLGEVSVHSDLFSLGLVLMEMLTGRRAVRDPWQVAPLGPPPIDGLASEVRETLRRCLDEDPDRRPRSAREVAEVLEAHAGGEAALAYHVTDVLAEFLELSDPLGAADPGARTAALREVLDRGASRLRRGFLRGGADEGFPRRGTNEGFPDHPRIRARLMNRMALTYRGLGQYDEARRWLEEALTLRRRELGAEHPDVAESLNDLADVLMLEGELGRAETLLRDALDMRRRALEEHTEVAGVLNNLAALLHQKGAYEEAESLGREALAMYRRLLGGDDALIARTMGNLGAILRARGSPEQAEPLYRQSLAMYRRLHGEEHPDVALSLNNLASWLHARGDDAEAEALYRRALAIHHRLLGEEHPNVAVSLHNLARVLVAREEYGDAAATSRRALAIFRRTLAPDHWRLKNAESVLAAALTGLRRFREAEPLLVESYPAVRDSTGEHSFYTREVLERLIALYEAWERPEDAEPYRALWFAAEP